MPDEEPADERLSRRLAGVLIVGNLLMVAGGCVLQEQASNWFGHRELAPIGNVVILSSIGFVTLLCGWGPGPVWIRALALSLVICLAAVIQVAIVYILRSLAQDDTRMPAGVAMQIATQIGNGLAMTIPMMMVLSMLAALGRWRLGPRSLPPIQIRILHVMAGTAALAILFVVNPEVQYRFFEIALSQRLDSGDRILITGWLGPDSQSEGYDTSVSGQRFTTMMLAAIAAPIAALVTATSAWSLLNRYAWIGLVTLVLVLLGWILLVNDVDNAEEKIPLAAFITCTLIAISVRWNGRVNRFAWIGLFILQLVLAIAAPIAALVTAIAAWSLLNRRAWIGLVTLVLVLLGWILLVNDVDRVEVAIPLAAFITCTLIAIIFRCNGRVNRYVWIGLYTLQLVLLWRILSAIDENGAAASLAIILACTLIAINVGLIGRAGWPLSRRLPASKLDGSEPEPLEAEPQPAS